MTAGTLGKASSRIKNTTYVYPLIVRIQKGKGITIVRLKRASWKLNEMRGKKDKSNINLVNILSLRGKWQIEFQIWKL